MLCNTSTVYLTYCFVKRLLVVQLRISSDKLYICYYCNNVELLFLCVWFVFAPCCTAVAWQMPRWQLSVITCICVYFLQRIMLPCTWFMNCNYYCLIIIIMCLIRSSKFHGHCWIHQPLHHTLIMFCLRKHSLYQWSLRKTYYIIDENLM